MDHSSGDSCALTFGRVLLSLPPRRDQERGLLFQLQKGLSIEQCFQLQMCTSGESAFLSPSPSKQTENHGIG